MFSVEKRIITWFERHSLIVFAAAISVLAAAIRLHGWDFKSHDYAVWLKPWYDEIVSKGGLPAVSEQIGDYNVLYQLLIALLSYLPIHPLTLYKGLSVMFDYLLAGCCAWMTMMLTGKKVKAALAYALLLLLPSVFIDSAYWAQCDAIYSFFLLASVLCMYKERHTCAFVMVAIAFQFKLQTVFVFPFLLYMYVRTKRFSILNFAWIPLLGMIICLVCGRGPLDTFRIYFAQTSSYRDMSLNFPSIWNLITNDYAFFSRTAILLTVAVLGVGMMLVVHGRFEFDGMNMLNILIWSVWTCLLFLPAMHERYGYFLIILLLILAVADHRQIGYVVVCEIVTLVCYSRFVWPDLLGDAFPEYLCSVVYTGMYVLFIRQMIKGMIPTENEVCERRAMPFRKG